MFYAIKIKANVEDADWAWTKHFTSDNEFDRLKGICEGRACKAIIPAMLITVRTSNWEDFSKDFFLPTVVNHALKINNEAVKVFATVLAFVFNCLTFPVRVFTLIPRVIENAKNPKENHLLYQYLKSQRVSEQLLKPDHLVIRLEWEKDDPFSYTQYTRRDGTVVQKQKREQKWTEENINFIELPTYDKYDFYRSGSDSI